MSNKRRKLTNPFLFRPMIASRLPDNSSHVLFSRARRTTQTFRQILAVLLHGRVSTKEAQRLANIEPKRHNHSGVLVEHTTPKSHGRWRFSTTLDITDECAAALFMSCPWSTGGIVHNFRKMRFWVDLEHLFYCNAYGDIMMANVELELACAYRRYTEAQSVAICILSSRMNTQLVCLICEF